MRPGLTMIGRLTVHNRNTLGLSQFRTVHTVEILRMFLGTTQWDLFELIDTYTPVNDECTDAVLGRKDKTCNQA